MDSVQNVHVFLVAGSPKLQQCCKGTIILLDTPHAAQDAVGLLAVMVHFCFMSNLVSTRAFSEKLFLFLANIFWHIGLFHPRQKTLRVILLKIHPISPACPGPSGWQHQPLIYHPLLTILCHLQICGCTPLKLIRLCMSNLIKHSLTQLSSTKSTYSLLQHFPLISGA